ncbi:hypothetical protein ACFP2T_23945 [Plantactinospora solaniradicis]|uniref:Uncharacterized protein n=1 Tax=Plantactinospora solaniradicis TaxID=1723736 RepID=A0ABW1KBR0_9ACTN
MTERIRSLLDAAVADTRPRVVDPVSEVLRRGRAHRRHRLAITAAAGTVAIALLATGGLVAANRGSGGTTTANPSPSASAPPTLPSEASKRPNSRPTVAATVTDGEVRANGLILAAPKGWQVVQGGGQQMTDCDVVPRSVLINVRLGPGGNCNSPARINVGPWGTKSYRSEESKKFSEGISEIVLPGGQPAWLTDNDVENFRVFERSGAAAFNMGFPWAGTAFGIEVAPEELDLVLGSISSEPVAPGRLVLPDNSPTAALGQRDRDRIDSTNASAISQVLERLRGLDRVVQPDELPCASAQPLTPSRKLAGKDMAALTLHYPSGPAQAVVAISSTDECAFATSSMGGRVWLPAGFLAEIRALLADGEGR